MLDKVVARAYRVGEKAEDAKNLGLAVSLIYGNHLNSRHVDYSRLLPISGFMLLA